MEVKERQIIAHCSSRLSKSRVVGSLGLGITLEECANLSLSRVVSGIRKSLAQSNAKSFVPACLVLLFLLLFCLEDKLTATYHHGYLKDKSTE